MLARNILWICALPGLWSCSLGVVNNGLDDDSYSGDDWSGAAGSDGSDSTDGSDTGGPSEDSGSGDVTGTEEGDGETSDTGATDEAGDSSSDDSTGGTGPTVVETVPEAGAERVPRDTTFILSFDRGIDPASITTNGGSTQCEGTVQISADDFTTCLPLAETVTTLDADTRVELTATALLLSRGGYRMLVTTGVHGRDDVGLEQDYVTSEPFVARYGHTIAIDGINDFIPSEEALAASSPGVTGYVAWDETHVYLGYSAPDVASQNPALFWFAYLGSGESGSTIGVGYQNQEPQLPFAAKWHPRWKADNTYSNMQEYAGGWIDATTSWPGPGDMVQSEAFVEMRMPRAALGNPATLPVVMGLLREEIDNEATYGAAPAAAIVDGFDPDFEAYVDFDLEGSLLPSEHPVL